MRLIDTHTHLDFPDFDADRDEVLARSRALGVQRMVVLGAMLVTLLLMLGSLLAAQWSLATALALHKVSKVFCTPGSFGLNDPASMCCRQVLWTL